MNLLGLPRNEDYRACFVAPEGFKMVNADYSAEELVVIATLAREQVWIDALKLDKDLHSINAALIFGPTWDAAADEDCDFKKDFKKCHCKGHKPLRTKVKNLGFGLSYGLSAYGFAARNHTTEDEANVIIDKFFTTFPSIHSFLTKCGKFGISYKYTHPANNSTSTFIYNNALGRVRFFDAWKTAKKQDYYGNWVYANPEEMRGVMRASMNAPVQGFGADILKVALVLLRRWINNNNLREHIQIAMPYHDEAVLYARDTDSYVQLAKEKLEHYMKLSGKLLLKNNLLKAEAKVSNYWIKD